MICMPFVSFELCMGVQDTIAFGGDDYSKSIGIILPKSRQIRTVAIVHACRENALPFKYNGVSNNLEMHLTCY